MYSNGASFGSTAASIMPIDQMRRMPGLSQQVLAAGPAVIQVMCNPV